MFLGLLDVQYLHGAFTGLEFAEEMAAVVTASVQKFSEVGGEFEVKRRVFYIRHMDVVAESMNDIRRKI